MIRRLCFSLAVLAALPLFAATAVTGVTPSQGFTYAPTTARITGTELVSQFVECDSPCGTNPTCPVRVFFGSQEATVKFAVPDYISVEVPAQAAGTVNVRVELPGRAPITLNNGFTYGPYAIGGSGDYRRFLVPITTGSTPGAFGSYWATEFTMHNASDNVVAPVWNHCPPIVSPCPSPFINPQEVTQVTPWSDHEGLGGTGAWIHIPKGSEWAVSMNLRVRDISRSASGFGTAIPVVPIDDFREVVNLLDVPVDPRYRATLRAYLSGQGALPVRVTVYPLNGNTAIESRIIDPLVPSSVDVEFPRTPSYVQFDPLTSTVRAAGHERVRVEVAYAYAYTFMPPPTLWAMISMTNNVTQEVTAIVPRSN